MSTPARIKFIGRDWCGHCTNFKKTWSQISALAGAGNKKYFVADMRGPSPVGYFPSFTVDGNPELGEDFGRHMREYETPLKDRVRKAMDATSHSGYKKSLQMLLDSSPSGNPSAPSSAISDFIGSEVGTGAQSYGYSYGYDYQ